MNRREIRWISFLLLIASLFSCNTEQRYGDVETIQKPEAGENAGFMQSTPTSGVVEAAQPEIVDGVQVVHITVDQTGYRPRHVVLQAGQTARLVFERTHEADCIRRVQIPAYDVEPTFLPMNEEVAIEIMPRRGVFSFTCGMKRMQGTLTIRA